MEHELRDALRHQADRTPVVEVSAPDVLSRGHAARRRRAVQTAVAGIGVTLSLTGGLVAVLPWEGGDTVTTARPAAPGDTVREEPSTAATDPTPSSQEPTERLSEDLLRLLDNGQVSLTRRLNDQSGEERYGAVRTLTDDAYAMAGIAGDGSGVLDVTRVRTDPTPTPEQMRTWARDARARDAQGFEDPSSPFIDRTGPDGLFIVGFSDPGGRHLAAAALDPSGLVVTVRMVSSSAGAYLDLDKLEALLVGLTQNS